MKPWSLRTPSAGVEYANASGGALPSTCPAMSMGDCMRPPHGAYASDSEAQRSGPASPA